jgi:hypothetical protein
VIATTILAIAVILQGVVIHRLMDRVRVTEMRLNDLEMGRPVKIEDGPIRLARNRQDR